MIECCDSKIAFPNCKRRKKRRFLRFVIFIAAVLLIVAYYKTVVGDNVVRICSDYAFAYSTEAVNSAVFDVFSSGTDYSDFISVEKNAAGDIVMLSANTAKINAVNKEIERKTREILKEKLSGGAPVPFFAFTGIYAFSGYGREINFRFFNVSEVSCEFSEKFEGAGINQTIHSIYVRVNCGVNMEIPAHYVRKEYLNEVLLSETLLVGKVPEIFLKGGVI